MPAFSGSLFGFGEGDFAFGEFAGVDFFEHVDEGFGLGEVGIGMEAGFDKAQSEEFFGDFAEIRGWIVGFVSQVGDLLAEGAFVAFGFAGVFGNAESPQCGFAGGDVRTERGRQQKVFLHFFE